MNEPTTEDSEDYSALLMELYLLESSQEDWEWTEEQHLERRMKNRRRPASQRGTDVN